LHAFLTGKELSHLADAVENSRITVTAGELQIGTAKSYSLYFRDRQFADAVREVFGRPLKIQVNIDAGQPPPPANPGDENVDRPTANDDLTERALANPEVRRFQEAFPGSKVYKVRNLKE
jgi:DNA polymerase-3 subunit gamma/tau